MKRFLSPFLVALLGVGAARCTLPAQDTNAVDPRDFPAFQIISDRNIFDPNRRGPRVQTPREDRTPAIVDSFSLTGTLSYSNVLLAIFDGSKSDYHKVLRTGGQIAGHSVASITYDVVKLESGTNIVELKVGMQMRRSDDGTWSASEAPASYGSSYASSSSSHRRDSGFSSRDSGRFGSRDNSRSNDRQYTRSGSRSSDSGYSTPEPGETSRGSSESVAPPGDDVIARMMAARNQQVGSANPEPEMNPERDGNQAPDPEPGASPGARETFPRNGSGNENPNVNENVNENENNSPNP